MGKDDGYLDYILETDKSRSRWDQVKSGEPAAIYFWYRQSPRPFEVADAWVTEDAPARDVPGMVTLTLDTLGRLRSFDAVPSQMRLSTEVKPAPDWSTLFTESGLDIANFQSVPSRWTSPHESTDKAAWDGAYPSQPNLKMHVEAAAFEGKPVYFEIIDSWDHPREQQALLITSRQRSLVVLLLTVFITVMLGGVFLAWRNLRLGRGDRKGAFRLAVFVFGLSFLRWLFTDHHVATEAEAVIFLSGVRQMVFWAAFFWTVYIAFEPFVRRRWPGRIISWSRLLAGGFRDPLVGRDILIGSLFGVGVILCNFYLSDLIPRMLGYPPRTPWFDFPATQLLGVRSFAFGISQQSQGALMQSFILLFILFLLYIILRKEWLAAVAVWVIGTLALSLTHESLAGVPFAAFGTFLAVWVLYRHGLLALISALFFLHLTIFYPITSEFSAWYAGDFVLGLITAIALAVYGFYTSLAGQPLFRGAIPDD
jgi:serine/threonine-protein kinase